MYIDVCVVTYVPLKLHDMVSLYNISFIYQLAKVRASWGMFHMIAPLTLSLVVVLHMIAPSVLS